MTEDARALAKEPTAREIAQRVVNSAHMTVLYMPDHAGVINLAQALLEQPITAEEVVPIIARRLAKRQHGEHYEGYESSRRETAEDIAAALSTPRAQVKK